MGAAFAITPAAPEVDLDAQGGGSLAFAVTNLTGYALTAAARVTSSAPTDPAWLSVEPPVQRPLAAADSTVFVVAIAAGGARPGAYPFQLQVSDVANPDDVYTEGPAVTAVVPAPTPQPTVEPGYLPTFWGALAGDGVGLVAGVGLLILAVVLAIKASSGTLFFVIAAPGGLLALAGAGVGAWLVLRWRGYGWAGRTGIILGVAQPLVTALLMAVLGFGLKWAPTAVASAGLLVGLLAGYGISPFLARMAVLWLAHSFVPPWATGVSLRRRPV